MLRSLLLYASSSDKSHIILAEESICNPQYSEPTLKWFLQENGPGSSAGSLNGRCSTFSSTCSIIGVDLVATCPSSEEQQKYPHARKRARSKKTSGIRSKPVRLNVRWTLSGLTFVSELQFRSTAPLRQHKLMDENASYILSLLSESVSDAPGGPAAPRTQLRSA